MYSLHNTEKSNKLPADVLQVEALFEQGTGLVNEDRLFVGSDVFAVVDGATSLTEEYTVGCESGGAKAAQLVIDNLQSVSGSLLNRIDSANKSISTAMSVEGVDTTQKENRWSASVTSVRLHQASLEWCSLGDCKLILIYADGSHKSVGDAADQDSETLSLMKKLGGRERAIKTPELKQQLLDVRRKMNVDYGVLSGEENCLSFARTGIEPLDGVTDVLLFSDGLVLSQSDKDTANIIVDLYKQGGLTKVREYVRYQQKNDLAGITYPRFKHHDDISAIALHIDS